MGQKITEHPAVDYWVRLTREADKSGATLPVRGSSDKQELGKYRAMTIARTRVVASMPVPVGELQARNDSACGKCGRPTYKRSRRLWRSVYTSGGRVDTYLCRACRVV